MTRFIAGIAVAIVCHLLGWARIESAIRTVGAETRAAYHAAETELRATEASK